MQEEPVTTKPTSMPPAARAGRLRVQEKAVGLEDSRSWLLLWLLSCRARLRRKKFEDQMTVKLLEIMSQFEERFLIVAGKSDEHVFQPPERLTQRKLKLLESCRMIFGVNGLRIQFLRAGLSFLPVLPETV